MYSHTCIAWHPVPLIVCLKLERMQIVTLWCIIYFMDICGNIRLHLSTVSFRWQHFYVVFIVDIWTKLLFHSDSQTRITRNCAIFRVLRFLWWCWVYYLLEYGPV